MSVYMILDAEVHDPVEYEKYKAAAPQYVARHGGEYCCRGGAAAVSYTHLTLPTICSV